MKKPLNTKQMFVNDDDDDDEVGLLHSSLPVLTKIYNAEISQYIGKTVIQ